MRSLEFNQTRYLLHTVRQLKPVQYAYRAKYIAANRLATPRALRSGSLSATQSWLPLVGIADFLNRPWILADKIERNEFTFLNQACSFDESVDWHTPEYGRLWRYNLHYFDYLFPDRIIDPAVAGHLMHSWVEQNPPGTPDGWDPFPASLRLVNWIKYFSTRARRRAVTGKLLQSTYRQALWLEKHLEFHLLANHLLKNAKALIFAGLFFKGQDAARWLKRGIGIYCEQLAEQILPDGGHFERSPMYHSMILEDCLDLINIFKMVDLTAIAALGQRLAAAADRMVGFLLGLTHPDGQIALFNDAACGIEPSPASLAAYYRRVTNKAASPPAGRCWRFPDTGYYIMAPSPGNRLLVDCGPVGPDYQPGHAHCDTLSVELSLKGRRVIVDSGCFQYEDAPIRQYNRGNAGHNALTVAGENQSEVWAAHRCARRAYPLYADLKGRADGSLSLKGAHDGYRRLKGRPVHHRSIRWMDETIEIRDRIEGRGQHDIESRLHIHPELKVVPAEGQVHVSDAGKLLMSISATGPGSVDIKQGWYCPEFNKKFSCPLLSLKAVGVPLPFQCGWKIKTV